MSWDYAELSKAAKEAGGPEQFVDGLADVSKAEGRAEMKLLIGYAIGFGIGVGIGISRLTSYIKMKRAEAQAVVEAAKEKLVKEIEEYDAVHSDDEENE